MKKIIKALKFTSVFLLVLMSFIACDKDFNTIESAVLGKDNANFNTNNADFQILAYNKKLSSLQINGLPSNLLGVFNDPAYGQTTASVISQITPTTFNPDFGVNPVINEVILNIPYYSTITETDPVDGNNTYVLDSLYGNSDAEIKLSIYLNNYFLRDFNPDPDINQQNYYSNADSGENSVLNGTNIINFDDHIGELIHEVDFTPSADEIVVTTGTGDDEVVTRSAPALRLVLNNDLNINFWTTTILDKEDDPVLSNANNFYNYFRGLYFKAEAIGDDGNIILMNFASTDANITINYTNGEDDARIEGTYTLNFTGNRLNTFINNFTSLTLEDGDKVSGDEKLYLKGAEGSMAVVDLFNGIVDCNGSPETALDCFKKAYRKTNDATGEYITENGDFVLKKLINEAHLIIYEDDEINTGGDNDFHKYDRIYAYDVSNSIPIIDYSLDQTENVTDPFNSKFISLGQRFTDDKGISKYKIRLTEHLNSILLRDSTNTKIGLVLSPNVNLTNNAQILNSNDDVTSVPSASLLIPRGTILYGTNVSPLDENKKMRLEIFFTEPNN